MGRGVSTIFFGGLIAVISAFVPVIGMPFMFLGVCMMIYGTIVFCFGLASGLAKGSAKAAKHAVGVKGKKKGSGKL